MPIIFTKPELENLKKIARNFSSIDIQKLDEIENYLQNYINANQTVLDNEEKQKKVQAAHKLLYYVKKPDGPLSQTISDMRQTVNQIDAVIEEMGDAAEVDAEPYLSFNQMSIFTNLALMNPQGEENMGFDDALTTFLEGEDFEEYKEGSVMRNALAGVKASQQAYQQYNNLMDLGKKRAFKKSGVFNDFDNKKEALANQLVMPLVVAQGSDHFSFIANDRETEQLKKKLEENNALIPDLTQKYQVAYKNEQEAEKKYQNLIKQMEPLDKDILVEQKKLKDLDLQKNIFKKKSEIQKAIVELSKAYESMKDKPAEQWPFAKEASDQALLEQAKSEYKEKAKLLDQNLVVDTLVDKNAPNRDYTKKVLLDYFDATLKYRRDDQGMGEITVLYQNYMGRFKGNTEAMRYLFAENREMEDSAFQKLNEQNPETALWAKEIKTNLLKANNGIWLFFHYDFEDPKGADKKIEDRIKQEQKEIKDNYWKNPVRSLQLSIRKCEKELTKLQQEFDKAEGVKLDAAKQEELFQKMKKLTIKKSELTENLRNMGITQEMIKSIDELAVKHKDRQIDQLVSAKDKYNKIETEAKNSKKNAESYRKAMECVEQEKWIMEDAQFAPFFKALKEGKSQPEAFPKDNSFFERLYRTTEEKYKMHHSEKLKPLMEEKSRLAAEAQKCKEVLDKKEAQKLENELSKLRVENKRLTAGVQRLNKVTGRMKKIASETKSVLKNDIDQIKEGKKLFETDVEEKCRQNIYNQIARFKEDYHKCLKPEYVGHPEKNSDAYKRIWSALNAFGENYDAFKQLSRDEISAKLTELSEACKDYKKAKEGQWFHFNPSGQRRYRISLAERMKAFADGEKDITVNALNVINDEKLTEEMAKKINKSLEYDFKQQADLAVIYKHIFSHSEVVEKAELKAKSLRIKIDDVEKELIAPILEKKGDDIKQGEAVSVLFLMDHCEKLKEQLNDPESMNGQMSYTQLMTDIENKLSKKGLNRALNEIRNNKELEQKYIEQANAIGLKNMTFLKPEDILKARDIAMEKNRLRKEAQKEMEQQQPEKQQDPHKNHGPAAGK